MKIYIKKGNKNYKERKILDELKPILDAKKEKDSNFTFTPARNFDDLKQLYKNHMVEDVESEDIPEEKLEKNNIENEKNMAEEIKEKTESTNSQFIDPFNQKEPIVRDYVFGDQSIDKNPGDKTQNNFGPVNFNEPQSFEEAFVIPDDDEAQETKKTTTTSSESKKPENTDPVNPKWDEMKGSVQKKKTKKFAKYIVEAVATLQQKGFVWYANKDINDAKLNEYEINGEMDLSLLVTLADGQEVTVKQFFQSQCMKAEQMSHISDEQKSDLTDSLTEVLMEQGAGPTPTQELMLVTLTIIGGQALTLMTLKSETNSLLSQLRSMNDGSPGAQDQSYKEPWHEQENPTDIEDDVVNDNQKTPNDIVESTPQESIPAIPESLPIGETIETKE